MQAEYVGIDLHRRRSVIVRKDAEGEILATIQIDNEAMALAEAVAAAGEHPEVVLEATYGWYWAADVLTELGARVHLAHPLGNNWGHRRVKNDQRDAEDLIDLLRLGRLAEAYVAPPGLRQLRELVRHRAKLVALRSSLKAQVHAVLAKQGVAVNASDLFGVAGRSFLDTVPLDGAYRMRVDSLLELIDRFDDQVADFEELVADVLADHPGYHAIQAIPGVGPVLAAVFLAEVGDAARFASPAHLCSWAGLTPTHRESHHRPPRPNNQTGVPSGALGGHRGGRPPTGRHPHPPDPPSRRRAARLQRDRPGCRRPQASRPRLLRPARRLHPLPGRDRMTLPAQPRSELAICHDPRTPAWSPA